MARPPRRREQVLLAIDVAPDPEENMESAVVRDITTGEQLEESRQIREALMEAQRIAGIGSFRWKPATGALNWSAGLNLILRRDPDQPAPTFDALATFYTQESWERLMAAAARGLETGLPDELEVEMIRVDGTTCWTMTRGEAVRGPDGSIVAVQGTVHDIDERKRTDRAIEEEKNFNRAVVDSLPGVFYLIDEHSHLLRWNKNFETVSGYSAEELSTMSVLEFFNEPDRSLIAARMQQVFTAGEAVVEASFVSKDRTQTPFLFSGKRFLVDGKPSLVGLGIDITANRQAERELRVQSAALNAASDAMIITDRHGTIEWVNSAFEALTGYAADEAIGKNPREILSLHDDRLSKDLWDTIQGGKAWHGEVTPRRKDGSPYPEDLAITPITNADGAITNFISIKRDLTKEKHRDAQFLQSQKMEVVGRLAGGIAHDFNNLLTVINGMAELASLDLKEGDPLGADLLEIRRAGERATSLTRQLLAFSRKQVMKVEVVSLATLVAGMWSLLQRLIGEDVTLVVAPARGEGCVRADRSQIEQVLMNLVVNARDAMPDGGTLTIEIENVELDEIHAAVCESARPGPYVILAVSDTGTGMDEVTRGRLFEPFFTTKEQGKGTGLGLATVYGIVKQSGGTISVDTVLGRGTTFKIYLPRAPEVADASQPIETAPISAATETILVVEDEGGVRHMARRMLESCGYTVLTASNAGEALLLLERHDGDVHLMLTDVIMPLMSGPDLAVKVAGIRPRMKVLFTSGYTDDERLRRSVFDEAAYFIGKPYTKQDLTRRVREVLDHADTTGATTVSPAKVSIASSSGAPWTAPS